MLMAAVICPEAFDKKHFEVEGYSSQVLQFLRGIESNGLIIIDYDEASQERKSLLWKEIRNRIDELDEKHSKYLRLITEFFKNGKIIRANVTSTTAASRTEWEVAKTVFDRARADTIIVESSLRDEFMKRGLATKQLTPLGSYILSDFESLRHDLTKQLVFDHNSIDKFNEMLSRLTRYSKRLKFYDKQIGTGEGLSNFFKGIGHILDRWLSAAHFPKSLLSIEVYTVHKQSQKDASTRHSLVFKNLACRLANEYGIKTSLHFKKDDPTMIHDRYLETDSVAVEVGRGFDLFRNGVLQTCSVSLSNSYFSHLNDWRNLADLEPTREIAPH